MKTFKKYGKALGFFTIFLFVFAAILTCFNLGNLLYQKSTDTFMMIGMSIVFMVIGFNYGKKAPSKGYLEGLKIGSLLIFFLLIINLLFFQTGFALSRIIYYIVLILASILGSMVGINKKQD